MEEQVQALQELVRNGRLPGRPAPSETRTGTAEALRTILGPERESAVEVVCGYTIPHRVDARRRVTRAALQAALEAAQEATGAEWAGPAIGVVLTGALLCSAANRTDLWPRNIVPAAPAWEAEYTRELTRLARTYLVTRVAYLYAVPHGDRGIRVKLCSVPGLTRENSCDTIVCPVGTEQDRPGYLPLEGVAAFGTRLLAALLGYPPDLGGIGDVVAASVRFLAGVARVEPADAIQSVRMWADWIAAARTPGG